MSKVADFFNGAHWRHYYHNPLKNLYILRAGLEQ